ncbi:MAG TPA: anthranilate phosphoribosyltransferase [Methylomirabilota bacterium]|nr:anthranilate phosphoribosyltransferase [Methylomirabilota bacterium]
MLTSLEKQLATGKALSPEQAADAVRALISEEIGAEAKADFLCSLAVKGETVEEIAGFARELRKFSVPPDLDAATRAGEILDVCGTGGDRLNTFNISTTVALIAAAAGVTVAKHGNRAVTSQSGSADVLEALGIRTDLDPTEAGRALREHQFAFFFAPRYHPAFKHIAPARKLCAERGQRTIFNFLGPLLNPAKPTAQLIGVPRPELCEPIARVLQMLGVRRGMVVCGKLESKVQSPKSKVENGVAFLDEFSTFGENRVAEFYQERGFHVSAFSPDQFPVQPGSLDDLVGGDRAANAEILKRILRGEERGPKRDATLLNAAAALFVSSRVKSFAEGWELGAELIDSGRAFAKLQALAAASR